MQAVLVLAGEEGGVGVFVDDVTDEAVRQVALYIKHPFAVADDIGDIDMADAVRVAVAVGAGCADDEAAKIAAGLGGGVHHAVHGDIVDMGISGQQAHQVAKVAFGHYVADRDIVDIRAAAGVVVVHHLGGAQAAAGDVACAHIGGEGHHIVTGAAGDIRNGDMAAAGAQVDAVLVFPVL